MAFAATLLLTPLAHAHDTVTFPPRKSAWRESSAPANPQALRQVTAGRPKAEVHALLNSPRFGKGYCRERQWNYLFDFPKGEDHGPMSCQYQVRFDENGRVRDTHWQDPTCEVLVTPPTAEAKIAGANASEHFVVGDDVLFAFDKALIDDLRPSGKDALEDIGTRITTAYSRLKSVTIIGHTDRLGSPDYQELSLARAQTVRDYLVAGGLPNSRMVAAGVGSSAQPVTNDCPAGVTTAAAHCREPDRRVTIDVVGERR
jgi:outer membrane protein OmpA-like peptidoglycan-associated protein